MLIAEMPVLENSQLKDMLPEQIEIRRDEDHRIVFCWDQESLYCSVSDRDYWSEKDIMPILESLQDCAFERKHPGEMCGMIRRKSRAAIDNVELSDADKNLWAEYRGLDKR